MANIAIVGVGAIGGVLAGQLHSTGLHALTLCTRRPLTGLQVHTPEATIAVEARNLTDPAQADSLPKPDWVLVATKTYDAAGARLWLRHLCGPNTRIAIIQNGVQHRENFAGYAILPVIIDVPAERRPASPESPSGSILQRGQAFIRVEDSALGHDFAALFAGSKSNLDITPDFLTAAWQKLCINCAGILSALTLKPAGVLHDESMGRVALDLVAECVAVGRAVGAKLEDGIPERVLANYRAGSPDSVNSLLADRLAGRDTEIEARNGILVRLGEAHAIPTPANRMAVALFAAFAPPQSSKSM